MVDFVGNGKVSLIASPERYYTDVAAKITRSEKGIMKLLAEPENIDLVKKIVESGHNAATEFDFYIFAVSGYSRVCEAQLVRKRLASYMIKSGRVDKNGKRSFDIVIPESISDVKIEIGNNSYNTEDIIELLERWYNAGIDAGVSEEDLRYMKPQATEFQGLIAMNAHALNDWFKIRCCMNAQAEIRDMALKMLRLCKYDSPALFEHSGASCVSLGYCPENEMQNKMCNKPKHKDILEIIKNMEVKK